MNAAPRLRKCCQTVRKSDHKPGCIETTKNLKPVDWPEGTVVTMTRIGKEWVGVCEMPGGNKNEQRAKTRRHLCKKFDRMLLTLPESAT